MRLFAEESNRKSVQESYSPVKIVLKPEMSIDIIGRKRFTGGIVTGAILLFPSVLGNILIAIKSENQFFDISNNVFWYLNFVHHLLSASLVSSITLLIWFFNKKWESHPNKVKQRFIAVNIVFFTVVAGSYIIKIPEAIYLGKFSEKPMTSVVIGIYGLLAYLVYSNNWNSISMILKTQKWKLFNLIFIVAYALIMTALILL